MIVDSEFFMNGEEVADNAGVVEYRIVIADLVQPFEEQEEHRERMNG